MNRSTRSYLMNAAIAVSATMLIAIVCTKGFTGQHTQTTTHTQEASLSDDSRIGSKPPTTAHKHTPPQRVKIPVKTKNRIPDKERADSSRTFLDRENRKFGTAMPIYKESMIDILKEESREGAAAALSHKEIAELEKSGDLIW